MGTVSGHSSQTFSLSRGKFCPLLPSASTMKSYFSLDPNSPQGTAAADTFFLSFTNQCSQTSSDTFTPLEVRFGGDWAMEVLQTDSAYPAIMRTYMCIWHTCKYQGVRIYSCNPAAIEGKSGDTPASPPKCVAVDSVRDPLSKCKVESNSENLTSTSGHHRFLHKHTNIHTTHTV